MRYAFGLVLFVLTAAASVGSDADVVVVSPQGKLGPCTVDDWKLDWPGCIYENGVEEERLSIVSRNAEKRFRVDFAVGEIGPEKGGVGWRFPVAERESATLSYVVRFCRDFDWVKGGKLPGLSGGPESVSGGRPGNGKNGFSCRLMWRADGRGEAYVYHNNQKTKYGDSIDFPEDFRFPADSDILVRMQVTMNSVGRRDGTLRVWIAVEEGGKEQLVVSRDDIEWRTVNEFGIDSILFQTFYGGSNKSWAPSRKSSVEFGLVKLK